MEKAHDLLRRLPFLDATQLREQWFLHYCNNKGDRLSPTLLRLAIAYRVQELETDSIARCASIRRRANEVRLSDENIGRGRSTFLRPGTRLLREYKGKVHEVLAIENGRFVYRGRICASLSEVSREITGSARSGALFFGLRRQQLRGEDG
jgi:hypothetical protein